MLVKHDVFQHRQGSWFVWSSAFNLIEFYVFCK